MTSLAVLLEIKKNKSCYGIRCNDCPINTTNHHISRCHYNPLALAEKELSKYSQEEIL